MNARTCEVQVASPRAEKGIPTICIMKSKAGDNICLGIPSVADVFHGVIGPDGVVDETIHM